MSVPGYPCCFVSNLPHILLFFLDLIYFRCVRSHRPNTQCQTPHKYRMVPLLLLMFGESTQLLGFILLGKPIIKPCPFCTLYFPPQFMAAAPDQTALFCLDIILLLNLPTPGSDRGTLWYPSFREHKLSGQEFSTSSKHLGAHEDAGPESAGQAILLSGDTQANLLAEASSPGCLFLLSPTVFSMGHGC